MPRTAHSLPILPTVSLSLPEQAFANMEILCREEFLASPYYKKGSTPTEASSYLVVSHGRKINGIAHTLAEQCIPLICDPFRTQMGNRFNLNAIVDDKAFKNTRQNLAVQFQAGGRTHDASIVVPTANGKLHVGLNTNGNIELKSVPKDLALTLKTSGVVSNQCEKFDIPLLHVNAQSFLNEGGGSFSADTLTIQCRDKVVNAGSGQITANNLNILGDCQVENGELASIVVQHRGDIQTATSIRNLGKISSGQGGLLLNTHELFNTGAITIEGHADITAVGMQNTGTVTADESVVLRVDTVHNTGHIAGQALDVSARVHVTNSGQGVLKAEQDLTVSAQNIDNDATVEGFDVQLNAARCLQNQTTGLVCAHGELAVQANAIENAGKVTAEGDVDITSVRIRNTGTVTGDESVVLRAATVQNTGHIAGQALNVSARVQITNAEQGVLKAEQELTVSAQNIDNDATMEGVDVQLNAARCLQNQTTGLVCAHGELAVQANAIENAGKVTAERDVDITAVGRLENKTGAECVAGGQLIIHQAPLVKNEGILNGKTGLQTESPVEFSNGLQGHMLTDGELRLILNGASRNDGAMKGDTLAIQAGASFSNTGTLDATHTVAVTSNTLFENTGTLDGVDITLEANAVYNSNTITAKQGLLVAAKTDLINADSGVLSATKVNLATKARFENAGKVLGSEGVTLEADSVINRGSSTTQGTLAITARTQVANQGQGSLKADHSVTVMASAIENAGMIEGADVRLEALQPFENQASGLVFAHGTLGLAANTVLNAGKINAEHRIEVTARERLENAINAECISEERITIHQACELVNHGTLEGKTGVELLENERSPNQVFANGQAGKVCSHAVIALSVGGNSCNAGTIQGGDVTVQSKDAFTNIGNLNATDKVALIAEGKLENTGIVNGNAGIVLQADTVQNTGHIAGQVLEITAKTQLINSNQGVLKSDEGLTVSAQNIHNDATMEGVDVELNVARCLENQTNGSVFAQGGLTAESSVMVNAGQMKAECNVDITAIERLENKIGAECVSGTHLIIHQAQKIVNQGVLAGRNGIEISANANYPNQEFVNGKEGKIQSDALIIFHVGGSSRNEGTIVGNKLAIQASASFTNTGALDATDTVIVTSEALLENAGTVNGNTGIVLQADTVQNTGHISGQALEITAKTQVTNSNQGVLKSDQGLTVGAQHIRNDATITGFDVQLNAEQCVENQTTGSVFAQSGLAAKSNVMVNAGQMKAERNVTITAIERLENKIGAECVAGAQLIIHQAPMFKNDGILKGKTNLYTELPVEFSNGCQGKMLTDGELRLALNGASRNDGAIKGDTLAIQASASFSNAGVLDATNTVTVTSETLLENSGTVNANASVALNAECFMNTGGVTTDGHLSSQSEKLVNHGKLSACTARLTRKNGDPLAVTLDNAGGTIEVQRKLILKQGSVKNNARMEYRAHLENGVGAPLSQKKEISGTISSQTLEAELSGRLNNQNGLIRVKNRADLEILGDLQNTHGTILQIADVGEVRAPSCNHGSEKSSTTLQLSSSELKMGGPIIGIDRLQPQAPELTVAPSIPTSTLSPPTPQVRSSEVAESDRINTRYEYEDNDIQAILSARIMQLRLENPGAIPPNVQLLAAVDNMTGTQLAQRLFQERRNPLGEARTLLIPCNSGNAHWVGILLEFSADGSIRRAEYLDSLQSAGEAHIPDTFQRQLQAVYPAAVFSQSARVLRQPDLTSCGTYAIENLLASARRIIPALMSREEIRRLHIEALRQQNPQFAEQFYIRQRDNQKTVATLQQQIAYLRAIEQRPLPAEEREKASTIKQYLMVMPEPFKTHLLNVFKAPPPDQEDPDNYHAAHLRTIRELCSNTANALNQGPAATTMERAKRSFRELIMALFQRDWQPGTALELETANFQISYHTLLTIFHQEGTLDTQILGTLPVKVAHQRAHEQSLWEKTQAPALAELKNTAGVASAQNAFNSTQSNVNNAVETIFPRDPVEPTANSNNPSDQEVLKNADVAVHQPKSMHQTQINALNTSGYAPLHLAVLSDDKERVRTLLNLGADPDIKTQHDQQTALQIAAYRGNANLAALLVQHQANRDLQDRAGLTAADFAVEAGHSKILRLLQTGVPGPNLADEYEAHVQALQGQLRLARHQLILETQRLAEQALEEQTQLAQKVAACETAIAQARVKRGRRVVKEAPPLLFDNLSNAKAELEAAKEKNASQQKLDAQKWIEDLTEQLRQLHEDYRVDRAVIDDLDSLDSEGCTPLHRAVMGNQLGRARRLLNLGANPDVVNLNGHTALHMAARRGHADMVTLLLQHNAARACVASEGLDQGETAASLAKREGHLEIERLLTSEPAVVEPSAEADASAVASSTLAPHSVQGKTLHQSPQSHQGIWIKTRGNVRCTAGGEISAQQGQVRIKAIRMDDRLEAQKVIVDDSSRIGGTAVTRIEGFHRVGFASPAIGKVIAVRADNVQLQNGAASEGSVVITQTQEVPSLGVSAQERQQKSAPTIEGTPAESLRRKLCLQGYWMGGHFSLKSARIENRGTMRSACGISLNPELDFVNNGKMFSHGAITQYQGTRFDNAHGVIETQVLETQVEQMDVSGMTHAEEMTFYSSSVREMMDKSEFALQDPPQMMDSTEPKLFLMSDLPTSGMPRKHELYVEKQGNKLRYITLDVRGNRVEGWLKINECNLFLVTDLPPNAPPEHGKLYIEKQENRLRYVVVDLKGDTVEAFLDIALEEPLTLGFLNSRKADILATTARRGHTRIHLDEPVSEHALERAKWHILAVAAKRGHVRRLTAGSLTVHLAEGETIDKPYKALGSLQYRLAPTATQPLVFLADQKVTGDFGVYTPTPVIVGSHEVYVNVGGDLKHGCQKIAIEASNINLYNGRIASMRSISLNSQSEIKLGRAVVAPSIYSGVLCGGDIDMDAGTHIHWDHLKMHGLGNLTAKAQDLDNVSSNVVIKGDAVLKTPSRHRLLFEKKNLGGKQVPAGDPCAMQAHKQLYEQHRTLTESAYFEVGKKLTTTGQMTVVASQVHYGDYEGPTPVLESFIPYYTWVHWGLYGNPRKPWWSASQQESRGTPILGVCSIANPLRSQTAVLDMAGVLSASLIECAGVQQGNIGWNLLTIHLPAPKPFRSYVPLMEYAHASPLFEITAQGSYPTVYRPILPFSLVNALGPILVEDSNGRLRPNIHNYRCFFTPLQEEEYLRKAFLDAFKKGFFENISDPEAMLFKLRLNTEQWMNKNRTAVVPRDGNISDPMLVYKEIEFINDGQQKETVLVPSVCLPKHWDNPRFRDWRGGLFSSSHLRLRGATGSVFHILGNLSAPGKLTLVSDVKILMTGGAEGESILMVSSSDNVELISTAARARDGDNFSDQLRQVSVVAENTLEVLAGKDVILAAVNTQSGRSTYIEALGNIADKPVELSHQRVQHFSGRKCHGTITDTVVEQRSSLHKTDGDFKAVAGGSAIFYAPQIDAENASLLSQGTTAVVPTTQRDDHSEVMDHKKGSVTGSKTKHSESVSSQVISTPGQFNVQNRLTISGNNVQVGYLISLARENVFAAPEGVVRFTQGMHQSYSASQTQSRDLVWQSSRSEMTRALRYLASQIPGSIEVHAREIVLEQVRGTTLAFWERVQHNNATVTYQVLEEHYEHHSHSVQGPSQGLAIVVSLAAGIATFGAGTAFASGTLGIAAGAMNTAVAAGFSALCSQAAVALLQNQGNPFKAVESLASKETAKSLAMSMISAGIMHKIGEALKLPRLGEKKTLLQHAQYNIARASVNAALNMSIHHQSFSEAFGAALTDAAIGTAAGAMAQKMGGLKSEGHVSNAGHKVLHAALGAVVGTALNGSRGAIAGAMGAVIAETTAEALEPDAEAAAMEINSKEQYEAYQDQRLQAAEWGKFAAASIALLARQDVPTAVGTATYAVENNFLTSDRLAVNGMEEYEPLALDEEANVDEYDALSTFPLSQRSVVASPLLEPESRSPRDGWEWIQESSPSFTPGFSTRTLNDKRRTLLWSVEKSIKRIPKNENPKTGFASKSITRDQNTSAPAPFVPGHSPSFASRLPSLPQGLVDAAAGYGDGVSFGLTQWIREKCDIDGVVNRNSDHYNVALLVGIATPYSRVAHLATMGKEFKFGRNVRIAPFGNRTGHSTGELPHYHRRGNLQPNGEIEPGQSINRHRPWESSSTDRSFWDRF